MEFLRLAALLLGWLLAGGWFVGAVRGEELPFRVGFGEVEITPNWDAQQPLWMAGYAPGRQASGIHDPLYARVWVIQHGGQKLAFVSVDLVGLQLPAVRLVRAALPDYAHVTVASTHNHQGPDVIGIWGRTFFQRGVDEQYLALVQQRVVELVRKAEARCVPSAAFFGTAEDATLLHDSREPVVKDGVLRVLRFAAPEGGRNLGIVVQWSCHPETLGGANRLITADFVSPTVRALEARYGCPVVYFTGAVGGLMAPPRGRIRNSAGTLLREGQFEFATGYGEAVAELAHKAIEGAAAIELRPLQVAAAPVTIPVTNPWYRAARVLGVVVREGRLWTGDHRELGAPIVTADRNQLSAVETEVGCVRLGDLMLALIPGEIYPELVYGKIQDPVDPGADFPKALAEPSVRELLATERWMLLGLANDEIGYIIPQRQWDQKAPFAYGRDRNQYGEINACGPEVGPIIMRALAERVVELNAHPQRDVPPVTGADGGH